MPINPDDYRESMTSTLAVIGYPNHKGIWFGSEHWIPKERLDELKTLYDPTTIYIRTLTDLLVYNDVGSFLVERKSKQLFLEFYPLFISQHLREIGIDIRYSIGQRLVDPATISISEIKIPPRYRKEFEKFKPFILHKLPEVKFIDTEPNNGSGDPYIKL